MDEGVRSLVILATLMSTASADPLYEAELRVGYGLAVGGGDGMTTKRTTPLTLAAVAAIAINEAPPVSAYGGLVIETLDRSSAGVMAGVRLSPRDSMFRLAAAGTWIVAPYTLWGAIASAGACKRVGAGWSACGDLQLTTYVAGTDLPEGHTVTQIQAVLGMVFDAF
jgi:hypothetical protein